jgi:hypothetical protein
MPGSLENIAPHRYLSKSRDPATQATTTISCNNRYAIETIKGSHHDPNNLDYSRIDNNRGRYSLLSSVESHTG